MPPILTYRVKPDSASIYGNSTDNHHRITAAASGACVVLALFMGLAEGKPGSTILARVKDGFAAASGGPSGLPDAACVRA